MAPCSAIFEPGETDFGSHLRHRGSERVGRRVARRLRVFDLLAEHEVAAWGGSTRILRSTSRYLHLRARPVWSQPARQHSRALRNNPPADSAREQFNSKSQFRKQRVLAPCQGEMMALFTCWSLHNYDESACRAAYLALQSCSRTAVCARRPLRAASAADCLHASRSDWTCSPAQPAPPHAGRASAHAQGDDELPPRAARTPSSKVTRSGCLAQPATVIDVLSEHWESRAIRADITLTEVVQNMIAEVTVSCMKSAQSTAGTQQSPIMSRARGARARRARPPRTARSAARR